MFAQLVMLIIPLYSTKQRVQPQGYVREKH